MNEMRCTFSFTFKKNTISKGTLIYFFETKQKKAKRTFDTCVYATYEKQLAQNNVHTFMCGFLGLYCLKM